MLELSVGDSSERASRHLAASMRRQITVQPDGSPRRELVIEDPVADCEKNRMCPHLWWMQTGLENWAELNKPRLVLVDNGGSMPLSVA
jgi:hypothetical protein